jgi:hypothetical protein
LSELIFSEKPLPEPTFWSDATKYTSVSSDESFVEEIAYLMVTVFRH